MKEQEVPLAPRVEIVPPKKLVDAKVKYSNQWKLEKEQSRLQEAMDKNDTQEINRRTQELIKATELASKNDRKERKAKKKLEA